MKENIFRRNKQKKKKIISAKLTIYTYISPLFVFSYMNPWTRFFTKMLLSNKLHLVLPKIAFIYSHNTIIKHPNKIIPWLKNFFTWLQKLYNPINIFKKNQKMLTLSWKYIHFFSEFRVAYPRVHSKTVKILMTSRLFINFLIFY